MAVAFLDFGEGGVKFGVGVAHLVAVAGLSVQEGVAEVVESGVDGLGSLADAAEGLPSGFEEDLHFLGLARGFFLWGGFRAFVLTFYRDFDGGRFFFGGDLHFGQLALGFGFLEALHYEVFKTFATLDDGFMVCHVGIGLWLGLFVVRDEAARLEGGGGFFLVILGFFRVFVLTGFRSFDEVSVHHLF